MSHLQNLMIIASAGCGKTHRLVTRYLELLDNGVAPEKIIALTFTREASGEFLDSIFERLVKESRGSQDPAAAQAHLRQLVEKLPRLSLGTLDSFFARILRAFPLECGLTGELTPLDDYTAGLCREEAIAELLRESLSAPKRFQEFMDLLRQQSRNQEMRGVVDVLDTTVKELHEKFLLTPPGLSWGTRIWPSGNPWAGLRSPKEIAAEFRPLLDRAFPDFTDGQLEKWDAFFAEIDRQLPGGKLTGGLEFITSRVIDRLQDDDLEKVRTITVDRKKVQFSESLWALLVELTRSLIGAEIQGCIARSAALYQLMARFEAIYQSQIRSGGRLTFTDVTGLLARAAGANWGGHRESLINRQEIDFRIDGQFDHWLIDEFQDTSRLQWAALANLVDEVLQDTSGRRSFFYVGDIKQAIYAWRGGDPKLFQEIFEHYNQDGAGRLVEGEPLHRSYRSRPEILDAVNLIFGNLPALAGEMEIPATTLTRWESGWQTHTSALTEPAGYVSWRNVEDPVEETVRLVLEAEPLARGLTCAVLVQQNKLIPEIVEALRHAGIPASEETATNPCTDNLAGAALLAAFRLLAHPVDKLAEAHVRMTPFHPLLNSGLPVFVEKGRQSILDRGFALTAKDWIDQVLPDSNAFIRARLAAWVDAAAAFDAGGARGLDDFHRFIEEFKVRENQTAESVRVLTFHRAKGLGFDWVILPELKGNKLTDLRSDPLFLSLNETGEMQWGLDLPKQKIRQFDPVLGAAMQVAEADSCYETLCKFYVGLTRAKKTMHLITPPPPKKSTSANFIRLLGHTLGEAPYENGDARWFEQSPLEVSAPIQDPPIETADRQEPAAKAEIERRLNPSHSRAPELTADELLSESLVAAREHGNRVHEMLATKNASDLPLPPQAPARRYFETLEGNVWREKAFEVRVGEEWIRGVFDRVVFTDDGATLLEFKTENAPDAELLQRHQGQLASYKAALMALTGLPSARIQAFLVPVSTGRLLEFK